MSRNLDAARDGASPADRGPILGRRVHADAMRLHVARNPNKLIGGIGQHTQRVRSYPALDEIITFNTFGFVRDVGIDSSLTSPDSQVLKPRREDHLFN